MIWKNRWFIEEKLLLLWRTKFCLLVTLMKRNQECEAVRQLLSRSVEDMKSASETNILDAIRYLRSKIDLQDKKVILKPFIRWMQGWSIRNIFEKLNFNIILVEIRLIARNRLLTLWAQVCSWKTKNHNLYCVLTMSLAQPGKSAFLLSRWIRVKWQQENVIKFFMKTLYKKLKVIK